jgi:DNA mismatch endonuclease (patch repair protein)
VRKVDMADYAHSKEVRSYNMSRIRSKDTKPEKIVRKYLFSKGFRYRKNDRRYSGCPDIVLPKYRTAIFINGCFWHCHEGCSDFIIPKSNQEYWVPKLEKNRKRDEENYTVLRNNGWNVLVVWECELKKNIRDGRLEHLYQQITK